MSSNSIMCILPEAFLHWRRNPSHVNEKHIKSVCVSVCVCVCMCVVFVYVSMD